MSTSERGSRATGASFATMALHTQSRRKKAPPAPGRQCLQGTVQFTQGCSPEPFGVTTVTC